MLTQVIDLPERKGRQEGTASSQAGQVDIFLKAARAKMHHWGPVVYLSLDSVVKHSQSTHNERFYNCSPAHLAGMHVHTGAGEKTVRTKI